MFYVHGRLRTSRTVLLASQCFLGLHGDNLLDTSEPGRQSWALTPSLPRPKHEHSADAPHRSESLLGIKHSSGFRLGRLATSQVRNCRISFIRKDDCSSRGRSIPDPTLRHQNSFECDFMTLSKPYDNSSAWCCWTKHRKYADHLHLNLTRRLPSLPCICLLISLAISLHMDAGLRR